MQPQKIESAYLAISTEQQQATLAQIGALLKDNRSLQQSLANQLADNNANNERLFLDLLEIFDALESVTDYLKSAPDSSSVNPRIAKSLGALQHKFLTTLSRRQVTAIDFNQTHPDWQLCQIVDTQIEPTATATAVTKVVRKGFHIGDRLLRPVEVTIQKPPQ